MGDVLKEKKVEGCLVAQSSKAMNLSQLRIGNCLKDDALVVRVRFPLLGLLMDPGVGRVRDFAEHQQIIAPE